MSWSASAEIVRKDDGNVQVTVKSRQAQSGHGAAESEDALNTALVMARAIIETGVLGVLGEEVSFHVSLSGHSNPGHKPASGWSNDYMSIQITQQNPFLQA